MNRRAVEVIPKPMTVRLIDRSRCPLCGSGAVAEFLVVHSFIPIPVVQCPECGMLFSSKLLECGIHYYASHFGSDRYKKGQCINARTNLRLFATEINSLRESREKPRSLDIGSGYGFFSDRLHKLGFAAEGVEVSEIEAKFAQRHSQATTHMGTLETVSLDRKQYDLITCFEVLEHIIEPVPFLESIRNLLATDGLLLIVTDNFRAACVRALGPEFPKWIPHSHVTHYDPCSLARVLAAVGLEQSRLVSFTPWPLRLRAVANDLFGRRPKTAEHAFDLEDTLATEMARAYRLFHWRRVFDPRWAQVTARSDGRGAIMGSVARKART